VWGGVTGGDTAYDGEFWRTRSPLEIVDKIRVPAFVVGGLHDLFQRGTPLIYERLKRNVDAHLLMGPWTHLGGSQGDGLPSANGVPGLDQIALRWFDQHLKGIHTRAAEMPKVTQYTYGGGYERYETQPDWPHPRLAPTRRYLRAGRALSTAPPNGAEEPESFPQLPVSGLCTQSTSQWTAGLTEALPCTNDNRVNEPTTAVYTTPALDAPLRLSGPVLAKLWVTTTARDAVVNVRITDVTPGGASKELSGGWLSASFRAVDGKRSRWVRGQLLQPWHPFTRDSVLPVPAGKPVELPVEVFPVNAVIAKGHRLRVTVGPSDFPHAIPPLPGFAESLAGTVRVLHDEQHPSYVALPTLGSKCKRPSLRRGSRVVSVGRCKPLRVPRLVRG
jgi:putative CocE/NonD family hydrolase